jgi:hypothetical protein
MAKLSARDVAEIRAALARGRRGKDLAGQYEVSPNAISRIKNGQTWSSPC